MRARQYDRSTMRQSPCSDDIDGALAACGGMETEDYYFRLMCPHEDEEDLFHVARSQCEYDYLTERGWAQEELPPAAGLVHGGIVIAAVVVAAGYYLHARGE